jgi:hypothetical protein
MKSTWSTQFSYNFSGCTCSSSRRRSLRRRRRCRNSFRHRLLPQNISGVVLLCSVYSSSLTSSSCIVLLPKHFSKNSFSRNMSFLAINTLPSFFRVEGIPSGYSGITYKDTLIWVGNLLGCKRFTLTSHPEILRNDKLGFYPFHNSYGVVSTDLDHALFSVKAVVSKA